MKKLVAMTIFILIAFAMFANGQEESGEYGKGTGQGRYAEGADGEGRGVGNGQGNGQGRGNAPGNSSEGYGSDDFHDSMDAVLSSLPVEELSAEEMEGLLLMREEEKLARDVYLTLYDVWNLPVFSNIAGAEAQHMSSVKVLLDRYEMDDPVLSDEIGVFTDEHLSALYEELVAKGRESLIDALIIGATIEDLDIFDLQEGLAAADNQDIGVLYQNLLRGSRNHMRSFIRMLEREDAEYSVQYITDEYFQKILNINQEVAAITDPLYMF